MSVYKIGPYEIPIADCYLVGFFEDEVSEHMEWSLQIVFDTDDEDTSYASFNSIVIPDAKNVTDLQNKVFDLDEIDEDLDFFFYEGIEEDRLHVEKIAFGVYDEHNKQIAVTIYGILEENYDEETDEIEGEEFIISLNFDYEGIIFLTNDKNKAPAFCKNFLNISPEKVTIEYEESEEGEGYECVIYT